MTAHSESPKGSPSDLLPLFTFGTLRRGDPNHHFLAGHYVRWLPATLRDYRRTTAAHGFPAAVPTAGESVTGEVFFIRPPEYDQTMRDCDDLEDIPPGQLVGAFYRRAAVEVETPEGVILAWAYVSP